VLDTPDGLRAAHGYAYTLLPCCEELRYFVNEPAAFFAPFSAPFA
jgi:hypothetical protein